MEITKQHAGDVLEVVITGRLDAYWADHLSRALEETVRDGAHRIRLDMSAVPYMSSVGIRVLLKFYKQLQRIQGSFAVVNPSEPVKTVLELAGLEVLLATAAAAPGPEARRPVRSVERESATFDVYDLAAGAVQRCRVVGEPELLVGTRFAAPHCHTMKFPEATFGLGLGAFGSGFEECQARLGEFLCAAGAAAYLPTDGTNVPDYLVATGALVPELSVLYAVVCEGAFAQLVRFEAKPGARGAPLADVADACLEIAQRDTAGIVMVAESAGLMGAALRRSPACAAVERAPFAYPQIREWLSFTPERAFPRSLALVVGVVTRVEHALTPLLRPLGSDAWPAGHFHAAAFSYRPVQKGLIELKTTVSTLFEAEHLQGVLHLLNDDRAIVGAGQSEFVRGACWIGSIAEIVAERG